MIAINNDWNINCILPKYKNLDYIHINKNINASSNIHNGDPYYKDSYFWLKISNGTYPIKPKFTFVSIKDSEEPVLTVIDFEMKSTNFKSLLETMKEKYKNPISSSRNNLQNSYGANFQNEEYFWKDKDSEIQLTKYSSNYSIENSSVYFYLTKGGEQLIRLRDEKKSQDKTKGF
jgi:hypothetical protein